MLNEGPEPEFDGFDVCRAVREEGYRGPVIFLTARTSEEDKLTVARARKIQRFLSQPFHVAEQFTGMKGRYVKVEDTIKGFKALCAGDFDELPEQAFLYVGGIEEAIEKAEKMKAED